MSHTTKLTSNQTCSHASGAAEGPQVPVPPPFGAKQSWFVRRYQWIELIKSAPQELGTENIGIPRDWPLDEKYHASYWEYLEHILLARGGYTEAGLPPPWPYILFDDDGLCIGLGFLAAGEDVNDFAYLCCWFLEHGKKVSLMPPADVRLISTIIDENYYPAMLGVAENGEASGVDAHSASKSGSSKHPNSTCSNPLPKSAMKAKVPPTFGRGKSRKSQTFEWWKGSLSDPSSAVRHTLTIARGSTLRRRHHSVFWEARENFDKAQQIYAAAEIAPPWPYVLCDDTSMLGYGFFDADQPLDELAWIACMFLKRGLSVGFRTAEDVKALGDKKEPQK